VNPNELSAPERALWQAFPRGELVDLTTEWGVWARTIRAEVIVALLLGAVPADPGRIAAVRLDGARITGTLGLGHAIIAGPVRLRRCQFEGPIDLTGAKVRDVDLERSKLAGLVAPLAEFDGDLVMTRSECSGQIGITGAHITGALRMGDACLANPGRVALLANRLVVDDDLVAHGTRVDGEVRLAGARVGGMIGFDGAALHNPDGRALGAYDLCVGARFLARNGFTSVGEISLTGGVVGADLNFHGATLRNPGGNALVAHNVQVGSYLALSRGFSAQGSIWLSGARISAEVFFDDARVDNPGGGAIRCKDGQARTVVLGPGMVTDGTVDFRNSQFAVIRDDQSSWPRQLRLSGLSYQALDPPQSAGQRVAWLRRDVDGYLPQNYETLAAMYRGLGDDASARFVLLERERERRQLLPWHGRVWSWLQEVTVGYGYRPLRAAAWLVVFLGLGTLAFGVHHPPPLAGAPHPAFNPFIYTADLLVPLVNLGLRDSYDPQGPQRWLAYVLIAVGWIFVTTIAAGIARVLRRQ
jgi:hypothetical protein